MPITMNDLTISPDGIDFETLLNDWEWAMPEPLRPVLSYQPTSVARRVNKGERCRASITR
jgi:hypothetical protein